VSNLARPGGNVTGLSVLATELAAKRLEILEEIVPTRLPWVCSGTTPIPALKVARLRVSFDVTIERR
jgi:putative tryptophan/tyrosine transport system substrate-binding protein